ncbi:MAG: ECF-type sigma factor [Planctomycetota bacterium]
MESPSPLTQVFARTDLDASGRHALLLELAHAELRRMAEWEMRREAPGRTLQPTALVHEAYLRLGGEVDWEGRAHFFGAAAQAMRRVLIDEARKRQAAKRGGGAERVSLSELVDGAEGDDLDLLALDEALDRLEAESPRLAEVVRLRYFVGLSVEATADLLGVAPVTVKRDWKYARAWLLSRMEPRED